MSSQPEGLRTPQRATFDIFDDDHATQNPCNTFTPCTRLSRMTIESQSNGTKGGRFRTAHYQYPVTNFNDKLMEVVREEEREEEVARTHPNLDMFLSADSRISMAKDQFFSEDEESDDGGDLFSSSLCPMSSPERVLTRQSIFDDEPMHSPPPMNLSLNRKNIFDDDDDDEEEENEDEQEDDNDEQKHDIELDDDVHDPSSSWLAQIFTDSSNNTSSSSSSIFSNSSSSSSNSSLSLQEEDSEYDDENRAPRMWHANRQSVQEKKMRRTLPHEEDNNANERLPLREIRFEDYLSDDDLPAKKKLVLGNGKAHKMRFMRTLSPPRYAKRKGKEPAENNSNIMPTTTTTTAAAL